MAEAVADSLRNTSHTEERYVSSLQHGPSSSTNHKNISGTLHGDLSYQSHQLFKLSADSHSTQHTAEPRRATARQVTQKGPPQKRNSLFPVRSELARLLVVATQPVNTRLDQDEPELGIAVLPVPLQMLAHRHRLLDQAVEVLGDVRGDACDKPSGERQ